MLLPAQGRLSADSASLVCSYHGWEFGGSGACSAVPALGDAKALAAALASPRCVWIIITRRQLHEPTLDSADVLLTPVVCAVEALCGAHGYKQTFSTVSARDWETPIFFNLIRR